MSWCHRRQSNSLSGSQNAHWLRQCATIFLHGITFSLTLFWNGKYLTRANTPVSLVATLKMNNLCINLLPDRNHNCESSMSRRTVVRFFTYLFRFRWMWKTWMHGKWNCVCAHICILYVRTYDVRTSNCVYHMTSGKQKQIFLARNENVFSLRALIWRSMLAWMLNGKCHEVRNLQCAST